MSDGPILQLITSRGPKLQLTQRCESRGPILQLIQKTIRNVFKSQILIKKIMQKSIQIKEPSPLPAKPIFVLKFWDLLPP